MNEMKWIPVKERLPKEDGSYLVTIKGTFSDGKHYYSVGEYRFATNIESKFDDYIDEFNIEITTKGPKFFLWEELTNEWGEYRGYYPCIEDNVIAWIPLPEPYKEGGLNYV